MRIISLDPGTTTGVCTYDDTGEMDAFRMSHLGPWEHHQKLYQQMTNYNPDIVICESFTFRPNPGRKSVVLDSREYIGIAKLYCQVTGKEYVEQQPSQAKGFWDDDKIKTLGLWVPGKKHAMDALRHLLYYLVFKQNQRVWVEKLK